MKYNEADMNPRAEREFHNLKATNLETESKLDWLSLMTGVEFPEDEEEDSEDE